MNRYSFRPCMPGEQSARQRMLRAAALGTVSYQTLLRLMGTLTLQNVERIINQAMFRAYTG